MNANPVVFVVDNDQERRETIQRLAESMTVHCRTYQSGFQFLEEYETVTRGCLVCALRMPDMGGLQIQQQLLEIREVLPVVFVSKIANTKAVVRAMRKGAINFLQCPCDEQELWESIQHAIRVCELRERHQRTLVKFEGQFRLLRTNERELLELLMQGKNSRAIAQELDVSVRTVEAHRRKIMDMLSVDSMAQLCLLIARHEPRHCHFHNAPCFIYRGADSVIPKVPETA